MCQLSSYSALWGCSSIRLERRPVTPKVAGSNPVILAESGVWLKKEIRTVGDLREALKHSEDEEPLVFDLEENSMFGKRKFQLKCVGVGSSGGGRITVIWLDKPNAPCGGGEGI